MATVDVLLDQVKDMAPTLHRYAAEAETMRRLSRPVVDAMRQAGLYRMARPTAFGGLELDPVSLFHVVEEVARHESAAGWTLPRSLAVESCLAWLPDAGAAEILEGHPEVIFGTSFTPTGGQAIPVDGGYRLTGQWPFVSGAHDARWFLCQPRLMDGDQPRLNTQGAPRQIWAFLPAAHATILDTWQTMGMRGTGSHDVAPADMFVPERFTAPVVPLERPGTAYQGPLSRLTIWPPIALLAPPALGVARAALDDLLALARAKTPSYTGATLSARQVVQRHVAEAASHPRRGPSLPVYHLPGDLGGRRPGRRDHAGAEVADAARHHARQPGRGEDRGPRPCGGRHVGDPQRVSLPAVLQGCAYDDPARLQLGQSR